MKEITIIGGDAVIQSKPTLAPWGAADHKITGTEQMSVSDGYHTMDELYDHRIILFIKLCLYHKTVADYTETPNVVWRSKNHSDGQPAFGGTWFVLGIGKEKGEQITYHIPIERWSETDFAETLETAPEWDGHTSQDVLQRLKTL